MAVVLNSEENSYFSGSPLRRSHSQPKFITQSSYSKIPSRSTTGSTIKPPPSPSQSTNSSSNSSPRTLPADSTAPSYTSTPASSLSLDARCEEDEDQIAFPSYDDVGYYGHLEDLEPPTSPRTGNSYTVSPTSNSTSTNISRPTSPIPYEHAEDDNSLRIQPTRHVDYLSHNWQEEEIWASWRHVVSKRGHYNNSARLENASWRSWAKSKNRLQTVSPEKLNWLKDCDVTWLYGPLQSSSDKHLHLSSTPNNGDSHLSKSSSFLNKKPILKKRSMSELMLQRSLSSSSLLKQAAAAVQAQEIDGRVTPRPNVSRSTSNYLDFSYTSRRPSGENTSTRLSSVSSSGVASPGSGERRHIHFNEQVEQCIAVEMKGEDEPEPYSAVDYDGSDSDDGAIMMKRSNSKKKLPPLGSKKTTKSTSSSDSKTIAMLPSTTLKYREDEPEPQETAMKHSGNWSGRLLSPSPSQETLKPSKPSKPSTRLLLGDDDEEDADVDWQPNTFANRKYSIFTSQERMQGLQISSSSESNGSPSGMRRTPSGMFMPYEEDEDDIVSEGLFGKVVDTVNTAKDIAHVIWNVGWRR